MEVELKAGTQQADRCLRRATQAHLAAGNSPGAGLVRLGQHHRFSAEFRDAGPDRRAIAGSKIRTAVRRRVRSAARNQPPARGIADLHTPGIGVSDAQYRTWTGSRRPGSASRRKQVVSSVITAFDSNMYIAPSIWIDHENKNDYFLTAEYREAASGFQGDRRAAEYPGAQPRRRGRSCAKPALARRRDPGAAEASVGSRPL